MTTKLEKLVIKRSKWLRGEDGCLRRESDGKMCCLGFVAMACGARTNNINDFGSPADKPNFAWPSGFLSKTGDNSPDVRELIITNDNEYLTDEEREKSITKKMEKLGIKVEFVD